MEWCVRLTAWMLSLTTVVHLAMALSPPWAKVVSPSLTFTSGHGLGWSVPSDGMKHERCCFEEVLIVLQDTTTRCTGQESCVWSKSQHSPSSDTRLLPLPGPVSAPLLLHLKISFGYPSDLMSWYKSSLEAYLNLKVEKEKWFFLEHFCEWN